MARRGFAVVWQPETGNPRKRYDTFPDAQREAERLAGENPGKEFFVMVANSVSVVPPRLVTEHIEPPLPF